MRNNRKSTDLARWISQILIGLSIALLVGSGNVARAQQVGVIVKLSVSNGSIDGTDILILQNGNEIERFEAKKKRQKLDLSYGHQYTIRFEKANYLTKEIYVDTRNVPLHMREEYLDFAFEIELFPISEYPQTETDSLKMAIWQYNTDFGIFDYKRIDESFATTESEPKPELNLN
ncbi:MAG: hypothetical protein H6603_05320 [Flavobacteriales bacterium]|nr:hypothetical protein [Flavobacteriales bacterium]MCB9191565.1 hypothetical protein [Flavobacteriales bacterium]MCB9204380.1 hypothetical protein [Flavobacteriales bacterium]